MHQFPKFILAKNEPLHASGSSSAHHRESINSMFGTGITYVTWFEDSF
jgi:hypothetical protein